MRLTARRPFHVDGQPYRVGESVDVPSDLGVRLVAAGYAVPDTGPVVERAVVAPPEHAVSAPQKGRGRHS